MMKMKTIELADISHYRGELMGIAMVLIILFHVGVPRSDSFFGLCRMGNIGVDMFLFLSGIGLWFSWVKRPEWRHFYKRRFLRIYPAWLIIACLFYIPRFNGGSLWSWINLFGELGFNWQFWIHNELNFWYIPAIMMLYIFAPPYMELIRRHPIYRWLPVAMIAWCVAVQYVDPIQDSVGHIEIFWSRVPIFFIGINMGEMIRRKDSIDGTSIWMILFMIVLTLGTSIFLEQNLHNRFPLFIERMLYIPLTITSLILFAKMLNHVPELAKRAFRLIGILSLECYLIHVHFVLEKLPRVWSFWPKFFICLLVTLPLAWVLNKVVGWISKKMDPIFPD